MRYVMSKDHHIKCINQLNVGNKWLIIVAAIVIEHGIRNYEHYINRLCFIKTKHKYRLWIATAAPKVATIMPLPLLAALTTTTTHRT